MKINREKLYSGGDHYPTVRAWMVRLGVAPLDQRANATKLTVDEARAWIARLRPQVRLTVRLMHGSEGRGGRVRITLDRGSFEAGTMSLGTVLHEIAHSLVAQRTHEQRLVRRALLRKGKGLPWRPFRYPAPHGEQFCRVYARLLREYISL